MLPRDNKMFFISEAHNLDNKSFQTPMIGRLQHFDNVKEIIKVMNKRGPGNQTALNTNNVSRQVLENGAININLKSSFEMPKRCKTSLNRYQTGSRGGHKMSLEDKLLSGYYRVGGGQNEMDNLLTSSDED